MAEILVVYGTRHGHTAHIAERVASLLRTAGHEVDVRDARSNPALTARYQAVIVGASVHVGSYEREIRRWVRSHVDELAERATAFFSVSLSSASHDPNHDAESQDVIQRFFTETAWHPMHVAMFGGALEYSKYNPLVRLIMKHLVRREEHGRYADTSRNYDLTDYTEVDTFAHAFAAQFQRRELHATDKWQTEQA